jgi:hypothetical protein
MSITPGTSKVVKVTDPAGEVSESQTLNPPTPVEYGRTVSGGIQGDATAGSTLPIA